MSFFSSLFKDSDAKPESSIPWKPLQSLMQLEEITARSAQIPVVIFKHSTRCGISSQVLRRFEKAYDLAKDQAEFYYLDLLAHRDVSNAVADTFGVWHHSPQVLLIRDTQAVADWSHSEISIDALKEKLINA